MPIKLVLDREGFLKCFSEVAEKSACGKDNANIVLSGFYDFLEMENLDVEKIEALPEVEGVTPFMLTTTCGRVASRSFKRSLVK